MSDENKVFLDQPDSREPRDAGMLFSIDVRNGIYFSENFDVYQNAIGQPERMNKEI